MPEIPPEAIDAAAGVLWRDVPGSSRDLARTYAQAALEAAAPILAEAWKPKPRPRKPKREVLARCKWCAKYNRTASEWEQQTLKGVWERLCVRCANKRLNGNPWNALLPMRKIGSEERAENEPTAAAELREDAAHG